MWTSLPSGLWATQLLAAAPHRVGHRHLRRAGSRAAGGLWLWSAVCLGGCFAAPPRWPWLPHRLESTSLLIATDDPCGEVHAERLLVVGLERLSEGPRPQALAALGDALVAAAGSLRCRVLSSPHRTDETRPSNARLSAVHADGADALARYLEALYRWAEAEGSWTLLPQLETIEAGAERLRALEPTIGGAAADRLLALRLCTPPVDAGLELLRARDHFEAALARAPSYLFTRVDYATCWALRAGEPERAQELLHSVAAVLDGARSETRTGARGEAQGPGAHRATPRFDEEGRNRAARRQARRLLGL